MRIADQGTRYPIPDRTNHKVNLSPGPDKDYQDVGWGGGMLSDGRPFRVEYWWWEDVSILTYYMSTRDIEDVPDSYFRELLTDEGLLTFLSRPPTIKARKIRDASGHEMWAVNIAVGDEDELFVGGAHSINRYVRTE